MKVMTDYYRRTVPDGRFWIEVSVWIGKGVIRFTLPTFKKKLRKGYKA